ncbi:MAG: hypothetical protein H5U03_00320 [Clostridia bacterium]|nr:hypothetical protein [Clostridia bacterium]HAF70308.1 hypothetical protein [Candidatus Acetothermia bacterium]
MRLAIVGLGYVGLTTGVALAYLGHKVVGVEKDEEKPRFTRYDFLNFLSLWKATYIVIAAGTPQSSLLKRIEGSWAPYLDKSESQC